MGENKKQEWVSSSHAALWSRHLEVNDSSGVRVGGHGDIPHYTTSLTEDQTVCAYTGLA